MNFSGIFPSSNLDRKNGRDFCNLDPFFCLNLEKRVLTVEFEWYITFRTLVRFTNSSEYLLDIVGDVLNHAYFFYKLWYTWMFGRSKNSFQSPSQELVLSILKFLEYEGSGGK